MLLIAVCMATRPLTLLAQQASKLGDDINQPPLTETGSTELRDACRAFNTMRSRLLTDISRDLKLPITRMRLRAQMLGDDEQCDNFTRNLDVMQAIASETLGFLRVDDTGENIQAIDLHILLDTIKEDATEVGQNVIIQSCQLNAYPARPLALKRCIVNLVENAILSRSFVCKPHAVVKPMALA